MKKISLILIASVLMMTLSACGTIESGYTGVKIIDGIVQDDVMAEGRYGSLGPRTSVTKVSNKRQDFTYSKW